MLTDSHLAELINIFADSPVRRLEIPDRRTKSHLFLLLRKTGHRIVAEWYAVYYRGGTRKLTRIGAYPRVSLSAAREEFKNTSVPAMSPHRSRARRRNKEAIQFPPTPDFGQHDSSISYGEALILSVLRDLMKDLGIQTTVDSGLLDRLIVTAKLDT